MFGFPNDFFSMSGLTNSRSNQNALNNRQQGLFGNSMLIPMPFMPSPFSGLNSFFNGFGLSSSPFEMMDRMMRGTNNSLFLDGNISTSAPVHSFSSTTVMSYGGADGQPKVYHESTSRTRGPGGLEETRQAIRDSERGINKVHIGHRIGDRKHVVEREMNVQTGQISENIELENLDEEETDEFKREWRAKSARVGIQRRPQRQYLPELTSSSIHQSPYNLHQSPPLAIEYNGSASGSNRSQSKSKKSNVDSSDYGSTKQSPTLDLTKDSDSEDEIEEIEQYRPTQSTSSTKRKASWTSSNDQQPQRKHRGNRS